MFNWLSPRVGLVALALGLGFALAYELTEAPDYSASRQGARRFAGAVGEGAGSVLPDFGLNSSPGAYATMVERPLLNPTRKVAPSQAIAAAPEPPKPVIRRGLYQLIGITDFGDKKIAQVKEAATGRSLSVRVGDTLQELAVARVESSSVTLTFAGETDVIALAKFTPSGRVPQPAPVGTTPVTAAPAAGPVAAAVGSAPAAAAPTAVAALAAQPPAASNIVMRDGLPMRVNADGTLSRASISVGERLEQRRAALAAQQGK